MSGWGTSATGAWLLAGPLAGIALLAAATRGKWGWQHAACGSIGVAIATASAAGLRDPLAAMSGYTAALMLLNQAVPPLLLLAVPPCQWRQWRGRPAPQPASGLAGWLLDPWIAASVFTCLSVAVSLPGILEPALADALFSAPLGLFELLAGLLFWAQVFRPLRTIGCDWKAGIFVLAGGIPMTVVAVVWMLSPAVIYAPYLDVLCRWNITPLQDQRWAGFIMLLAGLPSQIAGTWLLVGPGKAAVGA